MLHRCRFRQMQIQTDTDSYSDRCKQVQSTESHKYKDEREQTLAADPDRCIAQNHINTEMNESKTGRQQQRATTDSDRQQTEQQIHTTNSDSRFRLRRTEPNKQGKTRQYPMQI
ncbi:hypothetical protein Tco_0093179 [Tanacetum coccineum]